MTQPGPDRLYWRAPTRYREVNTLHVDSDCRYLNQTTQDVKHGSLSEAPSAGLCQTCSPSTLVIEPTDNDTDTRLHREFTHRCVALKTDRERCEKDPLAGTDFCSSHHHAEDVTRYDDNRVSPSEHDLRYDNLSGFQRDILTACYAAERTTPAEHVDAAQLRKELSDHPSYDSQHSFNTRFYQTAKRLADRGWINRSSQPGDARRSRYKLTADARALVERALTHHHEITSDVTASYLSLWVMGNTPKLRPDSSPPTTIPSLRGCTGHNPSPLTDTDAAGGAPE